MIFFPPSRNVCPHPNTMFLIQIQPLGISVHKTAAQVTLPHLNRDQSWCFSRSGPTKPLECLLTWNHGELALLKAPPLRTFSDLAGRAGLRSLLNWATETPDLVATVLGRAIWGRVEAKITFKQMETVNPLLCTVSRFNAMNYVTDLHAAKQLYSSLSKLRVQCISTTAKWQSRFLGSKWSWDWCTL